MVVDDPHLQQVEPVLMEVVVAVNLEFHTDLNFEVHFCDILLSIKFH